ncbi:MAG TPA: flavin reductase family protein [Bryobacteraceae bacterium]|nr:flavin reductase family protein [Bryobacteraceae bacterium]
MFIDPRAENYQDVYKLLIGAIVPRPIAFVSTVSPDGVRNLAPFSFFTAISANPPVICFCPMRRPGPLSYKDTLHNIARTREFVVNIVSEEFAEKMNICSGDFPPEVDEFEAAGLTPLASDLIRPARVAESHVQMECKLYLTIEIGELPGSGNLVLGEVIRLHVDDAVIDGLRIDPDKLRAIGRMGGNSYTRTKDRFEMIRPKVS